MTAAIRITYQSQAAYEKALQMSEHNGQPVRSTRSTVDSAEELRKEWQMNGTGPYAAPSDTAEQVVSELHLHAVAALEVLLMAIDSNDTLTATQMRNVYRGELAVLRASTIAAVPPEKTHSDAAPAAPIDRDSVRGIDRAALLSLAPDVGDVLFCAERRAFDNGFYKARNEIITMLDATLKAATPQPAAHGDAAPLAVGADEHPQYAAAAEKVRAAIHSIIGPGFYVRLADLDIASIISESLAVPLPDQQPDYDALRRTIHELRTYSPAGDAYHGAHIHKGWADAIEAAIDAPALMDAIAKFDNSLAVPVQAEQSEPMVFDEYPNFNSEAMGCGLEDRNITDRYDAMRYGWDQAMERVGERIDGFVSGLAAPVVLPLPVGPSGWHPMEAAPKDGREILIRCPHQANTKQLASFNTIHNFWSSKGEAIYPERQECEWVALPADSAPAIPAVEAGEQRRSATDAEVAAWADRHDIANVLGHSARAAFEDAESLRMTFAGSSSQPGEQGQSAAASSTGRGV